MIALVLWDQSLKELFFKGGFAMWPLLGCSIVAVGLIADRALAFVLTPLRFRQFIEQLRPLVMRRQFDQAAQLCGRSTHPVAVVATHYLANRRETEAIRSTVLAREGSLALRRFERRLRGLSIVAHLSPLLGLLGTVTGLVAAFHQIELSGGQAQPDQLAAGIWEALITTVFGLVIAIPATAAYHVFERHVDHVAQEIQFVVAYLDEWLGRKTTLDSSSRQPETPETATQINT